MNVGSIISERRRGGAIALALFILAGLLFAPTAGASAADVRLTCDVRPVIIGHGPGTDGNRVWAYALDTEEVLWDYRLELGGNGFSPVDIGQDPYGRLYLSNGGSIYTLAAGGTADDAFDPGSGEVTLVAEITLAGESINDSMLAFDRFGKGYFVDQSGDFLVRFDPQGPRTLDGKIAGEKFADGLQAAGLPAGTASGDMFISNGLAYILWSDEEVTFDLVLVRVGLTAGADDYEWDTTAGVIGPVLDPEEVSVSGYGVGASGGQVFVGGNGTSIHELRLFSTTPELSDAITVPSEVYGLTGNGEAVFDACFAFGGSSAPAPHPMQLSCTPDPVDVGGLVTCEITDGDPGIDILWRASAGSAFAVAGVTLDDAGRGTFTFRAPAAERGQRIGVELVEWDRTDEVGVTGTAAPVRIPAGDGGLQGSERAPLALAVALLAVGALTLARLRRAVAHR